MRGDPRRGTGGGVSLAGSFGGSRPNGWRWIGLLIGIAGWAILLHLIEITVWALFYTWKKGMPDVQSAFFSAVTYTTTGYGDLVLPKEWRLIGGVEALTGILMCGWSTGFFFAVVSRIRPGTREPRTDLTP